jgi:hypothetical protein
VVRVLALCLFGDATVDACVLFIAHEDWREEDQRVYCASEKLEVEYQSRKNIETPSKYNRGGEFRDAATLRPWRVLTRSLGRYTSRTSTAMPKRSFRQSCSSSTIARNPTTILCDV